MNNINNRDGFNCNQPAGSLEGCLTTENNNLQKGKFSSPCKMFFHPMGFQFDLICDIIFNELDDILQILVRFIWHTS